MGKDEQLQFDFGENKKAPSKTKKPPVRKRASSSKKPTTTKRKTTVPPKTKKPAWKDVEPPKLGKRKGYRLSKTKGLALLLVALALAFCSLVAYLVLMRRAPHLDTVSVTSPIVPQKIQVEIIAGMSAKQVSTLLASRQVVDDANAFLTYLVDGGYASSLKSGTYLFDADSPYGSVVSMLTKEGKSWQVVVHSGMTLVQVDTYLTQRSYGEDGEFRAAAASIVSESGLSFDEGWFLAGTYLVNHQEAANDLAMQMYQAMLSTLQPLLGETMVKEYGVEGVLVIASMIQAETQDEGEMGMISGIIANRLREGIPLGIDATTRYETGDWKNPISQETFEKDTPYNTRRKEGLPPSGICCPSSQAVVAAARPMLTDNLYYLHGKDGKLHAARTYQEHQANIKRYL